MPPNNQIGQDSQKNAVPKDKDLDNVTDASKPENSTMTENKANVQNAGVYDEEKLDVCSNSVPQNSPHNLSRSPKHLGHQVISQNNYLLPNNETDENNSPLSPTNKDNDNVGALLNNCPMYNWQATKTTIRERFTFMFINKILCDVHFIVGKNQTKQRIPAHKFVLSCSSAVFDAMFNGPLSAKNEEIELPDVEPSAFLVLLRYIYSDEIQICAETVMATLYVAKKYVVPALEEHCVDFLKKNLGSDNAFTLLTQARLFDEPKLAALCLETIDNNTVKAFAAEGFVDIDLDTLCSVLKRDTLRTSELKLFKAVVRWAEAECDRQNIFSSPDNIRLVLGRALNLVRFPLMSLEEFASFVAQSGILTDKEALQIFLYFTTNPKPSIAFLDTPRCCVVGNEITVHRFRRIDSRWGYCGDSDRVRLVVDRKISIVGFGLYGAIHGPAEYEVLLQLTNLSTGKVCGSNRTNFSCDGNSFPFRVLFKAPVEIQPFTSYIASVTLKGPDSHYGTKGLHKVAVTVPGEGNGKVTFEFFAAGLNNGTTVEAGQIPEIIFHV